MKQVNKKMFFPVLLLPVVAATIITVTNKPLEVLAETETYTLVLDKNHPYLNTNYFDEDEYSDCFIAQSYNSKYDQHYPVKFINSGFLDGSSIDAFATSPGGGGMIYNITPIYGITKLTVTFPATEDVPTNLYFMWGYDLSDASHHMVQFHQEDTHVYEKDLSSYHPNLVAFQLEGTHPDYLIESIVIEYECVNYVS